MIFKNPVYLWALLGVILPIVIHLWSNKRGKVIKIGSIKYLNETDAAQTNSIRLNEIILLILRMLIIALISLLMAQPIWKIKGTYSNLTYVIEPSVLNDKNLKDILSRAPTYTEMRLFQKGMPIIDLGSMDDSYTKDMETPKYWQYMDELESLKADSVVILVSGKLNALQGKRPMLAKKNSWIVIDDENGYVKNLAVLGNAEKPELIGMEMRQANLNIKRRTLNNSDLEFTSIDQPDSVKLVGEEGKTKLPYFQTKPYLVFINASDEFEDQSRYFEKAFISISKFLDHPIQVRLNQNKNGDTQNPDLIINLGMENTNLATIKTISYKPSSSTEKLLFGTNKGLHYDLTRKLTAESIVDEHLLEELIEIMDLTPRLDKLIEENDTRTVSAEEMEPVLSEINSAKNMTKRKDLTLWFAFFLGLVFISERLISKRRKQ